MAETIPSFQFILSEFFQLCLSIHNLEIDNDQQIQKLIDSGNFSTKQLDSINLSFEKELKLFKEQGGFLLHQLFYLSEKENFYFFDCPLTVYKDQYETRKQKFLKENLDAKEKDFIQLELKNLKHPGCKRILEFPVKTMCKSCGQKKSKHDEVKLCKTLTKGSGMMFLNNQTVLVNYAQLIPAVAPWKYSTGRKINYLEKKLKKNKKQKKKNYEEESPNQPSLTINQSVILLDQLGVFANPILESLSKVKQAQLIGQLINRNSKNVKTAIEKLDNSPHANGLNYKNDINIIQNLIEN